MSTAKYILQVQNINKSFGGIKVLNDICLEILPGEVNAFMGENGAGKSTLMKIIMGIYKSDSGKVLFDGEETEITSPTDALKIGISMIHQELSILPELTVAENIFLGRESKHKGSFFVDKKAQNARTQELLSKYDLDNVITPNIKMKKLSIAQMQMVEIIKAVSYQSKVIIMDEPTSSLSQKETAALFKMINQLRNDGVSIIYISHRMEEIFQLADRITVLRDGSLIGTKKNEDLTQEMLIKMMVGCDLGAIYPENDAKKQAEILEVKNLTKKGVFEDVSFSVKGGEILGFAGLVGAGRSEVMKAIIGYDKYDSGEIFINGKKVNIKHPKDAKKYQIALVSEDRKELGLVLCRDIKENISLQNYDKFSSSSFIDKNKERQVCLDSAEKMKVKMQSISTNAANLSGGNQQKVVLAKSVLSNPKVMIIDEPTRGIDIGSKSEIYKMMVELARQGIAIIMISSEMSELVGMSDRVIVMSGGKIRGEIDSNINSSQENILKLAFEGV